MKKKKITKKERSFYIRYVTLQSTQVLHCDVVGWPPPPPVAIVIPYGCWMGS